MGASSGISTFQGMDIQEGKNPRLVWDGSTMYTPMDRVMNNMTLIEEEAEVTFGFVKLLFYWLIEIGLSW